MIHAKSLIYDYETFDSEGNADGVVRALDDISVDIKRGSFVAILGRNGSGKSTLAKQMNALLLPTSGTVWVDGKDTRDESELWNIRQSAGMVFQNPDNQIVGTVVEEDVGFGPENMGVPTEEIWVRVNKCLKRMGLEPFRYDSPNTLSGGQKQRLSIAGILAMEPKCIIMDEPTAMLDPGGRREVMKAIKDLLAENLSVVLITHYMEEAVEADYIYVMDQGHVVMAGTPVEIFSDIDTIRRYGLEPPQVVQVVDLLNSKGIKLDRSILTTEELIKALCQR
ncbi:MAG: energy-coupling factor transporter ATPase [Lachnospiraceae bacterium]|nr:energy-coupling factor transporter ATPase [Lachnospiraceae bacterium]MBQ6353896.1 energy-coupling factor transporter ATPase [Lachnospiraceae bacterium]